VIRAYPRNPRLTSFLLTPIDHLDAVAAVSIFESRFYFRGKLGDLADVFLGSFLVFDILLWLLTIGVRKWNVAVRLGRTSLPSQTSRTADERVLATDGHGYARMTEERKLEH
jgi:hypothetical protein